MMSAAIMRATVMKPCVRCKAETPTNVLATRPLCTPCHQAREEKERDDATLFCAVRELRARDIRALSPRPAWWRLFARSSWKTRRRAINDQCIRIVREVWDPQLSDPAAHQTFLKELRSTDDVAELPCARIV
jgi:hypothetical protein